MSTDQYTFLQGQHTYHADRETIRLIMDAQKWDTANGVEPGVAAEILYRGIASGRIHEGLATRQEQEHTNQEAVDHAVRIEEAKADFRAEQPIMEHQHRILSAEEDLLGRTVMTGERVRQLLTMEPREAARRGFAEQEEINGTVGYRATLTPAAATRIAREYVNNAEAQADRSAHPDSKGYASDNYDGAIKYAEESGGVFHTRHAQGQTHDAVTLVVVEPPARMAYVASPRAQHSQGYGQ